MNEKRFTLDSDFVKVTSQVAWDNQEEKGLTLMKLVDLLNVKEATIQQLEKENQRVYGIIEDGGVLLTEKQLLDVIGEDKFDMFFQEQATISALKEENEKLLKSDHYGIEKIKN